MTKPRFWLLAGPNGSGKSTLAETDVFRRLTQSPETPQPLVQLNADALSRELARTHPAMAPSARDLLAAQTIDAGVASLIEQEQSLLVETVLSTDKYLTSVAAARARNYWIGLIFVLLRHPDINVARVAQRVAQGGHDVDPGKIAERWRRSIERLPVFAPLADVYTVWDNSSARQPARLLIEATPDRIFNSPHARGLISRRSTPPPLRRALEKLIADR